MTTPSHRVGGGLGGLPRAQDVIEQVLELAGGECLVLVEESSTAEVRFANNLTTTNGVRRNRRVTVVRFVDSGSGMAAGVASRGGVFDLAGLVESATADAASSPPADDAKPLMDDGVSPSAFELEPGETDLTVLSGVLAGLAGAFRRAEATGTVLAGFAEHTVETVYLGSSTGLRLRHRQPTGAMQLVGRRADGSNSAWVGQGTPDFANVSIEGMEEAVVRRLSWGERHQELPAGRYPVILPPEAVADLMVGLLGSAGGKEAEDGRTVFSVPGGGTRVGERLAALPFRLRSDPREPGLECAPFLATPGSSADVSVFDNGMALSPTAWIDDGRLTTLEYHRAGAARAGVPAAPPVDNLVLEVPGSSGTVDDLVADTDRGLLLTCLWYIREVDAATLLMTGLTRDGVYVIEDGAVVGAANNFRFNESPVDLLSRTSQVGATVRALGREYGEWVNRTAMPPLRIPDFNMSSTSAAS
jgi:predicted Zn-dependent protease